MTKFKNITIGSDPEFFIKDKSGYISAIGLIPGSKKEPCEFIEGFSLHPDNVLAEGNIPPVNTKEAFIDAINVLKKEISKYAEIDYVSCVNRFPAQYLQNKEARTFGCNPSFDAWSMTTNRPEASLMSGFRTSSFHVHIGYEDGYQDRSKVEDLIRGLDLFLGLPSLLLDPDKERRNLYGTAGDYRCKFLDEITITEYRSLGGYMLLNDEYIGYVYDQIFNCIDFLNEGNKVEDEIIKECINNYDVDTAIEILNYYKINLDVEFNSRVRQLA